MRLSFLLAAGLIMASCQTGNLNLDTNSSQQQNTPRLTANPTGEVFGQGNIRVALLIPRTAPGNGAKVAEEIRNGALMALEDFGQNTIQLVIKDTIGQAATSQAKASEAVGEGASVILGPLFSANVSAASAMTQPAGRPIMAFFQRCKRGKTRRLPAFLYAPRRCRAYHFLCRIPGATFPDRFPAQQCLWSGGRK